MTRRNCGYVFLTGLSQKKQLQNVESVVWNYCWQGLWPLTAAGSRWVIKESTFAGTPGFRNLEMETSFPLQVWHSICQSHQMGKMSQESSIGFTSPGLWTCPDFWALGSGGGHLSHGELRDTVGASTAAWLGSQEMERLCQENRRLICLHISDAESQGRWLPSPCSVTSCPQGEICWVKQLSWSMWGWWMQHLLCSSIN